MEDVDSAPTAPTSTNQDAEPAHCEPALDRKNGKVLDSTHTVDNHKFLFCLLASLGKILNLSLVDNTNIYFVYFLYKGFRP